MINRKKKVFTAKNILQWLLLFPYYFCKGYYFLSDPKEWQSESNLSQSAIFQMQR
jgi:hypothetical protein